MHYELCTPRGLPYLSDVGKKTQLRIFQIPQLELVRLGKCEYPKFVLNVTIHYTLPKARNSQGFIFIKMRNRF